VRQPVRAADPWVRRPRRWDATSAPPATIIESAKPPAAPMPASPQSKAPELGLTRTIVGGVVGTGAWLSALGLPAGTSEPFGVRSVGYAIAGVALIANPSETRTAVVMRRRVVMRASCWFLIAFVRSSRRPPCRSPVEERSIAVNDW